MLTMFNHCTINFSELKEGGFGLVWSVPHSMWILVPPLGIRPVLPCRGSLES